jgi:hypothetical protein
LEGFVGGVQCLEMGGSAFKCGTDGRGILDW